MNRRIAAIILVVGFGLALWVLAMNLGATNLIGNDQGYEPTQPIAFSHRLHAGELNVACVYCHSGAEKSRHAGIPAASTCMNCHSQVTAAYGAVREELKQADQEKRTPNRIVSPELQKLYDAAGLGPDLKPDAAKIPRSIEWKQIHNLPAFVYFDHSRHVNAGVDCQKCHGPVESMERVRQIEDLSMGWCVNCHRDSNANGVNGKPVNASIDCAACHY